MIGLANCQLTLQVFYEHLLLKENPLVGLFYSFITD